MRMHHFTLPLTHQLATWATSVTGLLLPLLSPPQYLPRLTSIYLGAAPAYILFSIAYEPLFLAALAAALLAWVLTEARLGAALTPPPGVQGDVNNASRAVRAPPMRWADVRIAIAFLAFNNMAFFGTGNFASIASFELSSVYRFTTLFNPFVMGALLFCKLFIPVIMVACALSAICQLLQRPRWGVYILVLVLSDVMSIHFFFMVTGVGSWLHIGQSLSRFGILNSMVALVLLLFGLSHGFTYDLPQEGDRVVLKSQ